jgi:quaternary ammonium compound-resistance protein SugE
VTAAWTYLIVAGLFEIGWPLGLKWAQEAQGTRGTVIGVIVAVVTMAVSGGLLYMAQREIALGTSYAVWTGIGAAGTFLVGVWFFGDPTGLGRWLGAALIVAGVATCPLRAGLSGAPSRGNQVPARPAISPLAGGVWSNSTRRRAS